MKRRRGRKILETTAQQRLTDERLRLQREFKVRLYGFESRLQDLLKRVREVYT